MNGSDAPRKPDPEALFDAFIRRRKAAERVEIEDLCEEHPEHRIVLRMLWSVHEKARSATRPLDGPADGTVDEEESNTVGTREASERLRAAYDSGSTATTAELQPGQRVDRYRLLSRLGCGGFGDVFLAEQSDPVHRRVALKVIKPGMNSREVVARFEAERQALAFMNHPNIAGIYDWGLTEGGRPYFAMEYVSGIPITEYCDRNRLGITDRLGLFVSVCGALQHAHQKAIIHRDIKPSNVLVTVDGDKPVPKIIDFGIAKAINQPLTAKTVFTQIGQVIGTPAYMSPEQASSTGLDVDTRTDIYSLGVLLYELTVGALPHDMERLGAAGYSEIQRVILEEDPLKPSLRLSRSDSACEAAKRRQTTVGGLSRELREDVDWIIMKALEKDRTRRYPSASEFAADIERHLAHEPVSAGPPSVMYRVRKFVRKHRRVVAGLVLFLVVVVTVAFSTWIVSAGRFRAAREAEARRLLDRGLELRAGYAELKDEFEQRWPEWTPIWEIERHLANQLRGRQLYVEAIASLGQAVEFDPGGEVAPRALSVLEELRRDFLDVRSQRWKELVFANLRKRVPISGDEGTRTVRIRSEPAGARVRCFRYTFREGRLSPDPYTPGDVEADGDPGSILRIADTEPDHEAFRVGDEIVSIRGRRARTLTEFVRAMEFDGLAAGERVSVEVLRRGEGGPRQLSWTPFPRGGQKPAKPRSLRWQFGFDFEAYPLNRTESSSLGVTTDEEVLRFTLPEGSYLLLFEKDGHAAARLPLRIGSDTPPDPQVSVRLVGSRDVPAGFVYIPAGPVACGGDPQAFQSLARDSRHLRGFSISRFELTFREYLEFLNDLDGIDAAGRIRSRAPDVTSELSDPEGERVQIVPLNYDDKSLCTRKEDGTWTLAKSSFNLDWPLIGISQHAAREYAHWLNDTQAGRWRFRLPSDLEWEKVARGVDRRTYVWGDVMVWSFCWNLRGGEVYGRRTPLAVGTVPFDESIYGVRDLAGSASEYTSGRPVDGRRYVSIRGGNWRTLDEFMFRIATRNGLLPESPSAETGIRLVAELVEE